MSTVWITYQHCKTAEQSQKVDDIGKGSDFDDLIRLADVCAKELREKHPALVREFSDAINAKQQQQQQQGDPPLSTQTISTLVRRKISSKHHHHHHHHQHHHDTSHITEEGEYGRATGKKKLDGGVHDNHESSIHGTTSSSSSSGISSGSGSGSGSIVNPEELQREGKNKTAKL